MEKLLDFYKQISDAIATSQSEQQLEAQEKLLLQAQATITNHSLMNFIEKFGFHQFTNPSVTGNNPRVNARELLNALTGQSEDEELEVRDQSTHPSPFAGGINFGPEEPVLPPEEQAAEDARNKKIRADIEAATNKILKRRDHKSTTPD